MDDRQGVTKVRIAYTDMLTEVRYGMSPWMCDTFSLEATTRNSSSG
jgi:hypothetical protein